MSDKQTLIWYASYGSNLLYEKGFLCYIKGGLRLGCKGAESGCSNKTPPLKIKTITIPHPIYFAEQSPKWDDGGVAFIDISSEDKNTPTVVRMYLITKDQFLDVVRQENNNQKFFIDLEEVKREGSKIFRKSWYGNIVYLGDDEGYPIYTFTHHKDIKSQKFNLPSDRYFQIIGAGLKEALNWTNEEIADYLIQKPGVKGMIDKRDLIQKLSV